MMDNFQALEFFAKLTYVETMTLKVVGKAKAEAKNSKMKK